MRASFFEHALKGVLEGSLSGMVFQNIEFHNVEEIEAVDGGYRMCRIPHSVREQLNERVREASAWYSTGVELRFRMSGDSVKIHLRAYRAEEAQVAYIYYGSFQGGWRNSSKIIGEKETVIEIRRPENLDALWRITREKGLHFSPEIVRLVLPYGTCIYMGAEGETVPPAEGETPVDTYLAYGSSITHGSLALAAPYAYPFRIAGKFQCDSINLGFAGSAHLERAMAEYIVSRKDWNFASVEMGINMLGEDYDEALFEERVDRFTEILAGDPRPVFATDIFTHCPQDERKREKSERYREIVKRYAGKRLIFTEGKKLLGDVPLISQDLTHPSLEGMEEIVNNWYAVMRAGLGR